MGLFDSAIQNLSRMALNESGVEIPQVTAPALVDEFKATLDMMPSLLEEEMEFPVYAVPIRNNKRLGRYLIEMEDLSRYMLTNGITNILEAITYIGNNNGVRLDNTNVALVIDEASILQEMDDLGMNIGGSNSNEGNIGTVGLLGPHTDIGKFRRFANSREIVDTVANKYGLPLVKKNYTIGLVPVKHGDIKHDGNLQESAAETQAKKGGSEVLQEKPGIQKVEPKEGDSEDNESITESLFNKWFGHKSAPAVASPQTAPPPTNTAPAPMSREDFYNGLSKHMGAYYNREVNDAVYNKHNGDLDAAKKFYSQNPSYLPTAKLAGDPNSRPASTPPPAASKPTTMSREDFAKGFSKHLGGNITGNVMSSIYDQHKGNLASATKQYNASNVGSDIAPFGSGKSSTSPKVMHASAELDPNLQYLRDIALGKYDAEIMNEEYGAKY